MKKIIFFLLLISNISFSQADSISRLQVSVITCAPGNELYSIFGHTAIRIVDTANQQDIIFNYGTFDFEDPNFLMKFTRGKLDYFLSAEDATFFFAAYQAEGRTITEQVLQLSDVEKRNIKQALFKNISGNNKFYKYDFLFDNCTTRIKDLLKNNSSFTCSKQLVKNGTTFRNMLYVYLDSTGMCWSKLGIDLLLGSKIDKAVSIEQTSFLPDYLMFAIDSLNAKQQFISDRKTYKAPIPNFSSYNYLPLLVFSLLFLMVAISSFSKNKIAAKVFHYLSLTLLFTTGLVGCLLMFMWLGTDQKNCANNYNLLWALPTNIIAVFFANRQTRLKKIYFKTALIISILLVVTWFILPQQFNIAFLPLALAMAFCYKKFL